MCLPLFLAGEVGERRFAQEHPTITVDGCSKLCAKRGTEQYSGRVSASLVVSDILGDRAKGCHRSARDADQADEQAVWIVAERIAAEVDALTASGAQGESGKAPAAGNGACCACGSPSPEGKLEVGGKAVTVNGLPLIFEHLREEGPATRRRFGRHVVGNRANLSRDRARGRSRLPPGVGRRLPAVLPAATLTP